VAAIVLALVAGISWGVSDFMGGLYSRKLPLATVLLVSQTVGFVALLPLALVFGQSGLDAAAISYAVAGSASGLIGIAGLYRGMTIGTVSIVAPISATGAVIPVIFGLLRGERAMPLQSMGVVLALIGIVLASRAVDDDSSSSRRAKMGPGVGLAILAALGFGGYFVLLHEASTHDVLWAGVVQRLTGVCLMIVVVLWQRQPVAIDSSTLGKLMPVGVLDAGANVLYGWASTLGLISLAAVLASLFPVVTVILARFILRERLSLGQGAGVVFALAGVALIAAQ
jgi:drug/metabolite transporter (DMT)-like permease